MPLSLFLHCYADVVDSYFSNTYVPGAGMIGGCAALPIDGGATSSPERGFNHSTQSAHQLLFWCLVALASHSSAVLAGVSFVQYPLPLAGGVEMPAI